MKVRSFMLILALILIISSVLVIEASSPEDDPSDPFTNFGETETSQKTARAGEVSAEAGLDGGLLQIGAYAAKEYNPAVAYSSASGQYLVVWEYEADTNSRYTDIAARYVDGETGEVLNSYFLASEETQETNPDVAYDPATDRFLVVWDEYYCAPVIPSTCNYVIRGRLMDGTFQDGVSPYSGDAVGIASEWSNITTGNDLCDPAVAYNEYNAQFLTVYLQRAGVGSSTGDKCIEKTDYHSIRGQMLSSQTTDPVSLGPLEGFEIRAYGTNTVISPDVAWGDAAGNSFLATWATKRPSNVDYIAIAYVYDSYQSGGTQVPGTWLMAPYNSGTYPLTNNCYAPAVAYDPQANAFVVVFQHENGLLNAAIYGQRVRSQYSSTTFRYDSNYAFGIETNNTGGSFSHHYSPDITYSGTDNEMWVTYASMLGAIWPNDSYYWVHHRTLNGQITGERLQVRAAGADRLILNPAVAGGSGGGLIVWNDEITEDGWDVLGQRISSVQYVYLPVVIR